MLHPDFPVIAGEYQLTEDWSLVLPGRFNRRFEDDSLVIWRPELTFWAIVWNNDRDASMEARLADILSVANPERRLEQIERAPSSIRLTYELPEEDATRTPSRYTSISAYVISPTGHLQLSAYFDSPAARSVAYRVIHSARCAA